jgi:hypothetical protein
MPEIGQSPNSRGLPPAAAMVGRNVLGRRVLVEHP